jgi:ABC-type sugar transport system substrate-binding protein
MKKVVLFVLAVFLVFTCIGCGNKKEQAKEMAASGGKKTVTLGLAWGILDDGQTKVSNTTIEFLTQKYPQYEIKYTLTNADGKIEKLISDVESLLAKNPDLVYIMNSVGDTGVIPAIEACMEAKVPVGIGVGVQGVSSYTYLYEGFDQYSCGLVQAQYMEDYYQKNPGSTYNVGYLLGDSGNSSSQARRDGFVENFVDKHDNVKLVIEANANWNTASAQAIVEDWLVAYPEINVIGCVNDDEAQGVVNACTAAGRKDIIILGIDGSDMGLANVASGAQAMTCSISFRGYAEGCAQAMIDCIEGKLTSKHVSLGTKNLILVTKENAGSVVNR